MSTGQRCPTCHALFEDEDYCPVDGTRLVPAAEQATPPPETADQGQAETETARATAEPDPAMADGGSDHRLADLMRRMGLRRARTRQTPAEEPADRAAPSGDGPSPLPPELHEQGWRIDGPVEPHPGFDRWPVTQIQNDTPPTTGAFHRFRTDALTTDALYRRLERGALPRLPTVHGHGTVDLAGARADYELVSTPTPSTGLDRWLADSTPSERRALHLLPQLSDLLVELEAAELCALCIDPSLLLMRSDGTLWMTSAARLGAPAQMGTYQPELERSALLPTTWTAPEITQEGLPRANSMVFSAGQVLAYALWGQPCAMADLQRGAVPFASIIDPRLARVLMGCLWPRPAERWTPRELRLAATAVGDEALPPTPPWESLAPGAAATAFSFAGAAYWRLESLLDAAVAPTHWNEAIARFAAILDWAEGTAWIGQVGLLREALAAGRSRDWALVALAHRVRPAAPMTWRTLDLCDPQAAQSLARLAQDALAGNTAQAVTLRDLFRADLRGAWTPIQAPN